MPTDWLRANWARLTALSVFGIALVVALELVRPFLAGPVGFDSAASVIHFDRIVSGRHLEAFVTATPKPFLTVLYGLLHGLTGDWRAIALATIGAYALSVALGGWLAWRVAGAAAGAFAVVGLLGSEALLADVGISYALAWALLFWLIAGLAMTGPTPRPGLAGIALCLATLARLESLVLVVVALFAVAAATALASAKQPPIPRRTWLLALGLVSLPIMLVHDWLLTGDPFFWLSVSTRYSLGAPDSVLSPIELLRLATVRYVGMWVLVVLAVIGAIALLRSRRWVPLVGVVALGPGIGAFLMLLAIRGTYVSVRYLGAIDLAVVFAAAVGAGAIAKVATRMFVGRSSQRGQRLVPVATIVGAAMLAVAASWPMPSLNAGFRSSVEAQRTLAEHLDSTLAILRCRVAPLVVQPPSTAGVATASDPSGLIVLGPILARPRLAIDLDLPVSAVGGLSPAILESGAGFLPYGRYVVHDRLGDRPGEPFMVLEVDQPRTIGAVTLVPILADVDAGLWILRIDRPGSTAADAC
jgi:hypothetical protein